MTTTELIIMLTKVEFGASGRPREIDLWDPQTDKSYDAVAVNMTGDGIAGAELGLIIGNSKSKYWRKLMEK